jgi:transcriptional regulator of NAD metabolism
MNDAQLVIQHKIDSRKNDLLTVKNAKLNEKIYEIMSENEALSKTVEILHQELVTSKDQEDQLSLQIQG